jgi:hypothetical protein
MGLSQSKWLHSSKENISEQMNMRLANPPAAKEESMENGQRTN